MIKGTTSCNHRSPLLYHVPNSTSICRTSMPHRIIRDDTDVRWLLSFSAPAESRVKYMPRGCNRRVLTSPFRRFSERVDLHQSAVPFDEHVVHVFQKRLALYTTISGETRVTTRTRDDRHVLKEQLRIRFCIFTTPILKHGIQSP